MNFYTSDTVARFLGIICSCVVITLRLQNFLQANESYKMHPVCFENSDQFSEITRFSDSASQFLKSVSLQNCTIFVVVPLNSSPTIDVFYIPPLQSWTFMGSKYHPFEEHWLIDHRLKENVT